MTAIFLMAVFVFSMFAQAVPNACSAKTLPTFEQYAAAALYSGKPHSPLLATSLDRKYRTVIREAVAAGPNFAGHFAIAHWGCGTGCQDFVIIDVKTGAVLDPKSYEVGYHYPQQQDYDPGWECYSDFLTYRRDSRLLIVEGCLLQGKQCGRTYFAEEDGRLHQVAFDPDLLRDGKVAPF
jgi:hypothetical protein